MLEKIRIERYKSLYDVTINLEPLTVFIGPNGSPFFVDKISGMARTAKTR